MAEFNENGGLEISPGPRGYSIVGFEVSEDGTQFRGITNQPGFTNWVPLYRGPRGFTGDYGDPGESRLRVDEQVGYRVFQWDVATAGEQMIYGDTGVWTLADGTTWVRRVNNYVESNAADPSTLPSGFRPADAGRTGQYLTIEAWPDVVTGTITTDPLSNRGLEGYEAAVTQGYPGTAEEFMEMAYRVVLPPAGETGQVLTRTDAGSEWLDLPVIGPETWKAITLDGWIPVDGSGAFARLNNGTVELYGLLTYTGATATVGSFTYHRVGVLPPEMAPAHGVDRPVTTYRASDNQATMCRLVINTQGVISVSAVTMGTGPASFTLKANVAQVNLSDVSYALRNSSALPGA